MGNSFNTSLADAQGSTVKAMEIKDFSTQEYRDYEESLLENCRTFWQSSEGVAVYRRFRVPEVYSWACRDKELSLKLQLGALKQSMNYKADIPNFLEPWYGIGVVASAFGIPYTWNEGQAPAVEGTFKTAREAIAGCRTSVAESSEGQKVLEMIEYFLDQTKGQVPLSPGDTQSPLNIVSSYLMDSTAFMYEIYDHPDELKELLILTAEMEREFLQKQVELIGDALALPGHGFASARCFDGLGFSDDNILMFSDSDYHSFAMDSLQTASSNFKGPVFHSCGDWTERQELIRSIPSLIMADGAVGSQTDPSPNDAEELGKGFAGSGVTLHCRIVGDSQTVATNFRKLWHKGLKCIVATYCETADDQQKAYSQIHNNSLISM